MATKEGIPDHSIAQRVGKRKQGKAAKSFADEKTEGKRQNIVNKGKYKRHPKFVYKEPTWFNATDENNAPDLVPGSEKKLLYAVTSKEKNCAMANILNTFKVLDKRAAPKELAFVDFKNFNTVRDKFNESGYKIVLIDIKPDFEELSNVLSEHRLPMILELGLKNIADMQSALYQTA